MSAALVVTIKFLMGEVEEDEIGEIETRLVGVDVTMPFRSILIAEPDCWNA